MRTIKYIAPVQVIGILCFCLVGCHSKSVQELGSNYEEVTYITRSWEPEAHQVTLQYRKPAGRPTMIWAYVGNVVVTNDMAIFEARVDYNPRLFAVRGLEAPLDITDEVFFRWSKVAGEDFSQVLKTASIYGFTLKCRERDVYFEFGMWKNGDTVDTPVALSLDEIGHIMNEVRLNGIVHKTSVYTRTYKYLAKQFETETKK